MHGQFFEDHTGCEAAQYIHAKYSFDLSEVQFDVPAPEIEFFQLMGRIKLRIEQRGRENDLLGAKPRDGDCKSYQSQGEGCRQLVIVFFAPVGQTLGWFAPQHQASHSRTLFGRSECGSSSSPRLRRESLGSNLKNQHEYRLLRFDPMPSTTNFWRTLGRR